MILPLWAGCILQNSQSSWMSVNGWIEACQRKCCVFKTTRRAHCKYSWFVWSFHVLFLHICPSSSEVESVETLKKSFWKSLLFFSAYAFFFLSPWQLCSRGSCRRIWSHRKHESLHPCVCTSWRGDLEVIVQREMVVCVLCIRLCAFKILQDYSVLPGAVGLLVTQPSWRHQAIVTSAN